MQVPCYMEGKYTINDYMMYMFRVLYAFYLHTRIISNFPILFYLFTRYVSVDTESQVV